MSYSEGTSPLFRRRLGEYELIRRLAVGGMGEVFLAKQRGAEGFDRLVVIKCLLQEYTDHPELVEMFADEARIAAHLAHPNIVQIYDFGRDGDTYFQAMEYVPGQNVARLWERLDRHGERWDRSTAIHIIAETARALDFAHNAQDAEGRPLGLVHRDISPHNVLISRHGDVKLMDFGIAKAANQRHRTETGAVRGKISYMAPEQVEARPLDARTDVFALGVMLWELTVGRRLFGSANQLETMRQLVSMRIQLPEEFDHNYPTDLSRIVMGALKRDPAQRTQSAGILANQLTSFLAARNQVVNRANLGQLVTVLFPEQTTDPSRQKHIESIPSEVRSEISTRAETSALGHTAAHQAEVTGGPRRNAASTHNERRAKQDHVLLVGGGKELSTKFGTKALNETATAAESIPIVREPSANFKTPSGRKQLAWTFAVISAFAVGLVALIFSEDPPSQFAARAQEMALATLPIGSTQDGGADLTTSAEPGNSTRTDAAVALHDAPATDGGAQSIDAAANGKNSHKNSGRSADGGAKSANGRDPKPGEQGKNGSNTAEPTGATSVGPAIDPGKEPGVGETPHGELFGQLSIGPTDTTVKISVDGGEPKFGPINFKKISIGTHRLRVIRNGVSVNEKSFTISADTKTKCFVAGDAIKCEGQ